MANATCASRAKKIEGAAEMAGSSLEKTKTISFFPREPG
jgi:hypothetical protein